MATRRITTPVEVRDNGVRSFIPPTFCFDLVTVAGDVVDTVSAVVLQAPGRARRLEDFEAVQQLSEDALMALGEVSEYDAGPQARELGRRFTATELIARDTVRAQHGSAS
jgi:hypothetical protein